MYVLRIFQYKDCPTTSRVVPIIKDLLRAWNGDDLRVYVRELADDRMVFLSSPTIFLNDKLIYPLVNAENSGAT